MIHVIATIDVTAGKREAVLSEFARLVPLVRAEAGCLLYEPSIDTPSGLAAQIPLRDDVITVVEKWESVDALLAHSQATHMTEFRNRTKGLIAGLKLQTLQAVC